MDSEYADIGYRVGQLTGLALMVTLVVWAILAIRRNNANQRSMGTGRDPRADIALLSMTVRLHAGVEQALALVSGIAAASGRLLPTAGPLPAWRVDGGHPLIVLEPTTAGSVLAVRELVMPLPSPQGAIMWEWVIAQVEHVSAREGLRTSRAGQTFVPTTAIDAHPAIWTSAG